jgi:16S rRNA (guanine527-N7)-methyltransferase
VSDSEFAVLLRARALEFGVKIPANLIREFEKFYGLLAKWNRRINLTALDLGSSPVVETLDRLLIEPLIASALIPSAPSAAIDLGSGAGSPALPLKILRPSLRLTMVEARGRKAAFLREAVRTLGLNDVDVEQARFQSLPASMSSEFDVVTVRALRPDAELLATVVDLLKPTGRFVTFGVTEELPGFVADEKRRLPDGSYVISWWPSQADLGSGW